MNIELLGELGIVGIALIIVHQLVTALIGKFRTNGAVSFTREDKHTLQKLGDSHLVNAKDNRGRYIWWGLGTTEAVEKNTVVLREVLAELKKLNKARA